MKKTMVWEAVTVTLEGTPEELRVYEAKVIQPDKLDGLKVVRSSTSGEIVLEAVRQFAQQPTTCLYDQYEPNPHNVTLSSCTCRQCVTRIA